MTVTRMAKERVFSERLLHEARVAATVLEAAMVRHGAMVTAQQVMVESAYGGAPFPQGYRLARIMEPLIDVGTVRVVAAGRRVYYGVTGHAKCAPPGIEGRSNLSRVEEALGRAVSRAGGAVSLKRVEEEIAGTVELSLDAGALSVAYHLGNLCKWGRAKSVRPAFAGPRRKYYTTPNGPTAVLTSEQTELDKRRLAIRRLWRRSEGRPFTTAAVRKFATADASLRIQGDVPTGWTNALQHLEDIGELVAIREAGERWVRWAVADEWLGLGEKERAGRLRDDYRCLPDAILSADPLATEVATVLAPNAAAVDVAGVSRAVNMRTVLSFARATLIATEHDPRVRAVRERRPVSREEITAVERQCKHLLGDVRVTAALAEASRLRKGSTTRALFNFGQVGQQAYFDLTRTQEGIDLVECLRLERELQAMMSADAVANLRHAEMLATDRTTAVHPALLYLRASALACRIGELVRRLDEAAQSAPLLPAETLRVQSLVSRGQAADADAQAMAGRALGAAPAWGDNVAASQTPADTMHLDVAADLVAKLAGYQLACGQELSSRLPAVGIGADLLLPAPVEAKKWGRRRERVLDRVGFANFASLRWGGPAWTTVASAGFHTMGELRDPEPFIRLLSDGVPLAYHAGLLASLGMFDTPEARDAVASYLARAISNERTGAPLTPMHAMILGVSGLARKYVGAKALELAEEEREALIQVAEWRSDDGAGDAARRALTTWESPDEALRFFRA